MLLVRSSKPARPIASKGNTLNITEDRILSDEKSLSMVNQGHRLFVCDCLVWAGLHVDVSQISYSAGRGTGCKSSR